MSLENMDGLNWVFGLTQMINGLNVLHSRDNHVGEEVTLSIEELGGHGGLASIDESFSTEGIDFNGEIALNILHGLFQSKSVSRHDGGGVNVVLDQLVTSSEELSSKDNNGGRSITDLSVLNLGKLNQDFGGWMSDLQLLKNCGAIVGDGNIANIVDEHLIETLWTERGLNDVGEGEDSHDVLSSNILTLFSLTEDTNL